MEFVCYPDPRLAAKAEAAPVDARLVAIGERLRAAAAEVKAYGLAAAHIGEVAPVIVLNTTPEGPEPTYVVCYNPRIEAEAGEAEPGREASVSLPGVEAEIERPAWAEIAWQDAGGDAHQERMTGFLARCALHEIEQMNGRFFLRNLSCLKREALLKKASKRQA
ncbi:MAG: peptide deformylase [Devosia sp.]|nr:peptide deformylase [Devosia sp.]